MSQKIVNTRCVYHVTTYHKPRHSNARTECDVLSKVQASTHLTKPYRTYSNRFKCVLVYHFGNGGTLQQPPGMSLLWKHSHYFTQAKIEMDIFRIKYWESHTAGDSQVVLRVPNLLGIRFFTLLLGQNSVATNAMFDNHETAILLAVRLVFCSAISKKWSARYKRKFQQLSNDLASVWDLQIIFI